MPLRELKHTDATELRAFQELPLEKKLDEIFLNGRETNGAVAEAKMEIEANRLLADKAVAEALHTATTVEVALNHHLEAHKKSEDEHKEEIAGINFIKRWGARGTALILATIGASESIVLIVHYVWGVGK